MKTVKRLAARLSQMTDSTYTLLRGALLVSCTTAAASVALFWVSGGPTISHYAQYRCAEELFSLTAAILLVAVIASACVEELTLQADSGPDRK